MLKVRAEYGWDDEKVLIINAACVEIKTPKDGFEMYVRDVSGGEHYFYSRNKELEIVYVDDDIVYSKRRII